MKLGVLIILFHQIKKNHPSSGQVINFREEQNCLSKVVKLHNQI